MSEAQGPSDRRTQHVAFFGFVLQLAAFGAVLGVSLWSDSHVLAGLSRLVLIGVPIWLVLYLTSNQIRRVGVEALETEELRRAQEAGTSRAIFEFDEEALLLEQNRLKWVVRWLLPGCTVVVSLLLLIGHFALWGWSLDETFNENVLHLTEQPTLMMWFVVGVGFICFLYARYVLALASLPGWQLLRAGAVCMAGNAWACVLVWLALMASGTIEWTEPLTAYLLRVVLIVLGVEFAANFILDLYRPRVPGQVTRPSFDSRLLGMIAEPGGITKSIADAVNYQFGFQVSSTWFFQLLQRWLFPITVLAFIAVILLTGIVIVDADEQVVIERFGRPVTRATAVLSPGLYFKWPYPIDAVYRAPVKRVNGLVIGEAHEDEEHEDPRKAIVWTEVHEFVPEMMLLVASPQRYKVSAGTELATITDIGSTATESVAVSLLMVSVPIEYRIRDLAKHLYNYEDAEKLVEVVAYKYLSDYAAGVELDEFIGPRRHTSNRELKRLIQARLDELDAGIELVFVGIRGAHPPAADKVAAAFEGVVSAETQMAATVQAAQGEAQRILTSAVGSVARATALDGAIQAVNELDPQSPELVDARQRIEDLLMGNPVNGTAPVSGRAAVLIARARAKASRLVSDAAAKARVFGTQVAAYQAAPALYMQRKSLEVYEELEYVRKYLIVGDPSNVIIEYETFKEAGLDQVLSEGVEKERRRRNP
ncbi:MAG: hypothetical protein JSU86_16210 [Phycisphaerales bacterium]|nr:MAG: hypothetical protein JSU86_16210 [Phycisphaerales bacterium]